MLIQAETVIPEMDSAHFKVNASDEQFPIKYQSNGTNTLRQNESTTQIIFDTDIWMAVWESWENIYMIR